MRMELRDVVGILMREIESGGSLFKKNNNFSFDREVGMIGGVRHCVKLLTKIDEESSRDIGKYLSFSGSLSDDYPRKGGPKY